MDIRKFVQAGRERKAELDAEFQRAEAESERRRLDRWRDMFEMVKEVIPEDFHHLLIAPDYDPINRDYKRAGFDIIIPGEARIWCDPDGRTVRFTAKYPRLAGDEFGDDGFVVEWRRSDYPREDFLIALAEAVDAHEDLPGVVAECGRRNAERQAERQNEVERIAATDTEDNLQVATHALRRVDDMQGDWLTGETPGLLIGWAGAAALVDIAVSLRKIFEVMEAEGNRQTSNEGPPQGESYDGRHHDID